MKLKLSPTFLSWSGHSRHALSNLQMKESFNRKAYMTKAMELWTQAENLIAESKNQGITFAPTRWSFPFLVVYLGGVYAYICSLYASKHLTWHFRFRLLRSSWKRFDRRLLDNARYAVCSLRARSNLPHNQIPQIDEAIHSRINASKLARTISVCTH